MNLKAPQYTDPIVDRCMGHFDRDPVITTVWWGDKYDLEYLVRLKRALDRNMPEPFRFQVITDHGSMPGDQAYADTWPELAGTFWIGAVDGWQGWWQKIGAFDSALYFETDRVMLIDLDIVVTGGLDKFFYTGHHTCAIANFGVNFRHSKYNSSIVVFDPHGPAQKVHDDFRIFGADKVMKALHGDQCFFWRSMVDDVRVFPHDWAISYKYEARKLGVLHEDTSAVIFHGKPDPHEVKDGFVLENWI